MKPRFLDAMGEALSLVGKSNLAEATALIRKALSGGESDPEAEEHARVEALDPGRDSGLAEAPALPRKSGEEAQGRKSEPEAEPARPPASALARPARRPLGEVLRAVRDRPVFSVAALAERGGRGQRPRLQEAPGLNPAPDFGDRFLKRAYRGAAGALNYRLYVPADHERRDLALVIMLHGCTQNPEDFALGTQMNGLADEFGLIVAYPHQTRRANPSGCWNWFDPRHQRRGSGEPAKLAGLAQELMREFGVGKDRVFAAGLSAGGAMAEVLAATYPDVFDAVGIHSGLAYKSAVDVPSAFAAMKGTASGLAGPQGANARGCRKIVFHGLADSTVHPVNGGRILDEAERGAGPLKRNDLDWGSEAGRVSRTVLEDPEGRPVVERWLVEGGGHAWFGGDPRGSYTQSVGLDASRVMVRFFLRQ
jgi:poly(hydroxyalkanoate) depolymerase family esterase